MSDAQTMTCMEVWGGSDAVDAAVALSGLDAWVYSRPYERAEAGGDVYYVSACATGRINRLLIADVSGHGERVRDVAVQLRDLMRRYVNFLDQSRFVISMNGRFVECSAAGCFATAVVTTFFAPTRTLSVCNAGHPPPLVWRSATRRWGFLDGASTAADADADAGVLISAGKDATADAGHPGNIPLGIVDLDDFDQFDVELDVGDLVLVYTDSLIEAKDASGEMLGLPGLLAAAGAACDPARPESLIPALLKEIDARAHDGLDADDVTALLLRANGAATRAAWVHSVTAPFRVIASLGRAALGRGPAALPDFTLANVGGSVIPALNRLWRGRRRGMSKSAAPPPR
jgi:serine phosphatase RsbU (regulator of sigma subunit)